MTINRWPMMKITTMVQVVNTLDAQGESPIATQVVARWAPTAAPPRYWRASANFLFQVELAGQACYLRFNHADERPFRLLEAEMAYLQHLTQAGLTVAQPIPSQAGNLIEAVETPSGLFYATLFEGLTGQQFEIEQLTLPMFQQWGQALGALHAASQGYRATGRLGWQYQLATVARNLPREEKATRRLLGRIERELETMRMVNENYGIIHFDFEQDNLVWQDGRIAMLDFDDCAWSWFVADIAYALRELFADDATQVDLNRPEVVAFVKGYRLAKPLRDADLRRIPLFLWMHHLIMYIRLQRALVAEDTANEPAWAQDLRAKLTAKVERYRDQFAAAPSGLLAAG
jgi:Ser/Thr protein kinase RdoA (MazF antagonist)